MQDRLEKTRPIPVGSAGAQRSFVHDCWLLASPTPSEAQSSATAQGARTEDSRSCAPLRLREARERYSAQAMGDSALCPRAPGGNTPSDSMNDWAAAAGRLLSSCPDTDIREDLEDLFEETAAVLEYDQELSRAEAEELAFGRVLFEMLRRSPAVRSVAIGHENDGRGEA